MLPEIPDISTLPVEQQVIAWVVFALISILALTVTKAQINRGRSGAATSDGNRADIAAVIVDSEPLNRATASVEAFSMVQVNTNMSINGLANTVSELADEVRELAKQIEILSIVMRK